MTVGELVRKLVARDPNAAVLAWDAESGRWSEHVVLSVDDQGRIVVMANKSPNLPPL